MEWKREGSDENQKHTDVTIVHISCLMVMVLGSLTPWKLRILLTDTILMRPEVENGRKARTTGLFHNETLLST
jgi:hypothetical protein